MQEITDVEAMKWWNSEKPYFTDFCFGFSAPRVIEKVKIERDTPVLEIGFGYGRELSAFMGRSDFVYGIDVRKDNIQLAKDKLAELGIKRVPTLLSYDGVNIPFDDNFFDVIYSCFVIQHMSKINAEKLIADCVKKLSEDGTIIHEFYGHPHFLKGPGVDAYSGDPFNGGMYNNAYSVQEIKDLVARAGGKIKEIVEWQVGEPGLSFSNYWVLITK